MRRINERTSYNGSVMVEFKNWADVVPFRSSVGFVITKHLRAPKVPCNDATSKYAIFGETLAATGVRLAAK